MRILTIKDASGKWGISQRRITALCAEGRIPGAIKAAGVWILPFNSKKPEDGRLKNCNYVNWRNKTKMSSKDFKSNLKNIEGTFAVEGMTISDETKSNLKRLADGKSTCSEIIDEIKRKYGAI